MNIVIYLIPISLLLGAIALLGFVWSVRSGQYDDLESERYRILKDEIGPSSNAKPDDKPTA